MYFFNICLGPIEFSNKIQFAVIQIFYNLPCSELRLKFEASKVKLVDAVWRRGLLIFTVQIVK